MDIAIVGLGCRFPSAQDPLSLWELVRAGTVTFRPVPKSRWDHSAFHDTSLRIPDKAYIGLGAYLSDEELKEFGALHFGIAPRRVQVTDPQQRLLIDVVRAALQDAGLEGAQGPAARAFPQAKAWDRTRTGVFVGASVSEYKELVGAKLRAMQLFTGQFGRAPEGPGTQELLEQLTRDVAPMRAFTIAGNLLNMIAATVAQQWDLQGPAFSIDSACSSALVATQQAVVNLRAGLIDTAIAGGVYLNLLPDNLVGFSRIGAISRAGACRPFDAAADGFVMGEGAGAVILKRREDAERDGDRIYALIKGAATNNDGRGEGPMTPRPSGQLDALRAAWKDAQVPATTLGYVEAHGTATTVGDVVEVGALRDLLVEEGWTASQGARTALGSIKANIGHTMSAAGVAGLLKATLALHKRTLPPQPSVSDENPKLALDAFEGHKGPFFLPKTPLAWEAPAGHPRRAAVSSFGFGGTNAHLVLEEAPRAVRRTLVAVPTQFRPGAPLRPRSEVFFLSGSRGAVAARAARALLAALPVLEREGASLADLALTLAGRSHGTARLSVVAASWTELAERLAQAARALDEKFASQPKGDVSEPAVLRPQALAPGVTFAQGPFAPDERSIALLFPGQGAQRVGLLAELAAQVPAFRRRLEGLDAALGPALHTQLGGTLSSFLYPELARGADGAPEPQALAQAQARLTATEVCQPAMAALGLALADLLGQLGVEARATLGHSLGEFVAASVAGVLPAEECVRLVAQRGLAMVALPLADRGAMSSIAADRATVAQALAQLPEAMRADGTAPVVAANVNHPKQTVISGATASVRAAEDLLAQRGLTATPLDVSHAFHSPLVAGIAPVMRTLLDATSLSQPKLALVSGTSGTLVTSDLAALRDLWVRHGAAPVDFLSALQTAAAPSPAGAGARIWLQVGAGGLVGMAKATLSDADRLLTLALAGRDDDGLATFVGALGQLWTAGVPLDLSLLFEDRAQTIALPPSPIETQGYWVVDTPPGASSAPIPVIAGAAVAQHLTQGVGGTAAQQIGSGRMDSLVELFRAQVELLRTQAQVLEKQAAALAGAAGPEGAARLAEAMAVAQGAVAAGAQGPAQAFAPSQSLSPSLSQSASLSPSPSPSQSLSPSRSGSGSPALVSSTPAASVAAPASPAALGPEITKTVLAAVARISAFPAEALKTTQTLVGDLGFDSLMTVELDGDLQKSFPGIGGLPRSLLGAATTIQHLVDHVARTLTTGPVEQAPRAPLGAALGAVASAGPEMKLFRPALVEVPLAAAEGRLLPKSLLITQDALGVAELLAARLSGLGHEVGLVSEGPVTGGFANLAPRLWQGTFDGVDAGALLQAAAQVLGPVGGILHLAPLDAQGTHAEAIEAARESTGALTNTLRPLLNARLLARAQAQAGAHAAGGLFVVATAGDGSLGLSGGDLPGGAVGAALGAFARSLARERDTELVKRVDLRRADGVEAMADALLRELRGQSSVAEVAWAADKRFEVELLDAPAGGTGTKLAKSDVVLVTGGARGVGQKLALSLAPTGAAFVLAGRSALTPDITSVLEGLKAKGARAAVYVRWDVAGPVANLSGVRASLGPISVVLHAAGVSEDGPLAGKDEATFLRVLGPKALGLWNVLGALSADPLRALVLVGSWSGRFGNSGQTDYAAANAILAQASRALPSLRSGMRALALDFPPWEGTAMVGKIPQLAKAALQERGVPFIDDAGGAKAFLAALALDQGGEVLLSHQRPARPLSQKLRVNLAASDGLLADHQLAGQPVLPLAAALDLLGAAAHAASAGKTLQIRDLQLQAPVRVTDGASLVLSATGDDHGELRVSLASTPLSGPRPFSRAASYVAFATAGGDVSGVLHSAPPAPKAQGPATLPLPLDEFYATATFHGPRMQGIASIEAITAQGIVGWVRTSRPQTLLGGSERAQWTVDPLALDGAFQLAGYWAWTQLQRAGLPVGIEEYVQIGPLPEGPLRASLTLEQSQDDRVRGTIVLQGPGGEVVAVARGVEGEFKHRDPRFLKGRGLVSVGPESATAAEQTADAQAIASVNAITAANALAQANATAMAHATAQANATAHATAALASPQTPPAPSAPPAFRADEATYNVSLFPEVEELEQRLGLAAAFGIKNPYFNVHERVTNDTSVIGGRTMINWSSYNYVGLSGNPHVSRAAQAAIEKFGTSVSASRVASGEKPLHRELEAELAQFLGTEDSIVMVSGHGVFVTTIGHMFGPGNLILHDALAHDCILGGSKLSGAKRLPFPHNDFATLERKLEQLRPHYRRVLIAVEGVYSMDGDICPLPEYIRLKKKYGAMLMVDEAHSIGVLGARGRGVGEHFGVNRADVDLWMGTMSKSLASCGGYVAGSAALVRYLKYTAPGFVFSVGISPANAAAGLESIKQIEQHPEKVQRLHERARLFLKLAKERGIDTGMSDGSAVVPCIVGNSLHSLQLSEALRQRGINVQPILYPAVEETAARLRFFITATHTEQQIRETVQALAEELARVRADSENAQESI